MIVFAEQAARSGGHWGVRASGQGLLAGLAVAVLAGAGPAAAKSKAPGCADGETRLPITGMCRSDAVKFLNTAGGYTEPPEGCSWLVQELDFAGQPLLYRGLKCGKEVTELGFAGGAQMAELSVVASSMGFQPGLVLVKVASADPAKPTANVESIARGSVENPTEAAGCFVRPAGIDSWPVDALVVDVAPEVAAKIPQDGPRTACGPYGLDEDSSRYWRVFQGQSWFFDLGQEVELDAGSFTLMTKDAGGNWTPVP